MMLRSHQSQSDKEHDKEHDKEQRKRIRRVSSVIRMKVLRNTSSASPHTMKSGRAPHGMMRLVSGSVHPGIEPNRLRNHEAGLGVVQLVQQARPRSWPCHVGHDVAGAEPLGCLASALT